ncbi:uncharacterized protein PV07_07911 [Cladophialophora immunda]|uniref:BTB domain-containing protein n=1 Tax=Cladophialophora immunda TaxID=569365 RepID=A0A0D2ASU0_9EURO|nr:uncharacterized protein PV07_07911 [Cladophialophora immunda]KIW28232.1 hypothetical protein PV07_07911 [Cladophialophora immunda]
MSSGHTRATPNLLSDLYLLAGFAVDFELRIPGYAFKCHREDLSRSSRYFANVCSGHFQEGTLGHLDLERIRDPLVVLRMIQAIYIHAYTEKEADLPGKWREYLESSRTGPAVDEGGMGISARSQEEEEDDDDDEDEEDRASFASLFSEYRPDHLFLHIDMYRLGEYYAIDALSAVSFRKFVGDTSGPLFSVDLLLWTIEYLYVTGPRRGHATLGQKMRMRAVYLAQKCEMRLFSESKFWGLMRQSVEFMWDYTTTCRRANYLQCRRMECEATFEPAAVAGDGGDGCDCAGQGVCRVCFEADLYGRVREAAMCPSCREGRLGRWNLESVDRVDITSVDAFVNMFHPQKET